MTLSDFLARLSRDGVAAVTPEENLTPDDRWIAVVRDWDAVQRNELAFTAPELSLAAVEWAAVRFYRGCREISPQDLRRFLPRHQVVGRGGGR